MSKLVQFGNHYLSYSSSLISAISTLRFDHMQASISRAVERLELSALGSGRLYVAGNGGSGATASHFVGDLVKGANSTGHSFDARCLSDNTATLTSLANDVSFEQVFALQIPTNSSGNDTFVALSGSGNSANIINAAHAAKNLGVTIIGLTGFDGGKLGPICDIHIHVDADEMGVVEDTHHAILHLISWYFIGSSSNVV